jgi:hypothetical protein
MHFLKKNHRRANKLLKEDKELIREKIPRCTDGFSRKYLSSKPVPVKEELVKALGISKYYPVLPSMAVRLGWGKREVFRFKDRSNLVSQICYVYKGYLVRRKRDLSKDSVHIKTKWTIDGSGNFDSPIRAFEHIDSLVVLEKNTK